MGCVNHLQMQSLFYHFMLIVIMISDVLYCILICQNVYFQLVKEQKGRITELSKCKQEQNKEYRVCILGNKIQNIGYVFWVAKYRVQGMYSG